ncbi:MAG TPA: M15 family metallopeptidase [Mycobacteriales bacterium]|nr:M15 family metallopeptidase [Mycobacteriales bacterium]
MTAPAATPFSYRTAAATTAELGKSWRSGCPVGANSLRAVTMTFWGFDNVTHRGTLVVNGSVVPAVVSAFRSMYLARFPIRRMVPIAAYGGSDDRSMAADNTSAFNCRRAVSNGPPSWSMHAYGEAIDFNPLENPYRLDGKVLPPAGAPYMDRSNVRRGMIVAGSAPVAVFSALHWGWGGNWSSTPDYQHFSTNGR